MHRILDKQVLSPNVTRLDVHAPRIAGIAAGLLLGAWWMTGAPPHPPDLLRAAPRGTI
mgnify:CR=1 FL=1